MDTINTEYSTKDLHLAAYLKLKEAELIRLEQRDSNQSYQAQRTPIFFVFSNSELCTRLEKLFWDEGDFVNIKLYIETVRHLRERVFLYKDSQKQV